MSKEEVNKMLKGKGVLENQGQSFIDAQEKYEVNIIYLISHAIVETGNGDSELAHGIKDGKHNYYNFMVSEHLMRMRCILVKVMLKGIMDIATESDFRWGKICKKSIL